jgi:hypothetical protein
MDEALKYELLGIDSIEAMVSELSSLLNQMSGEDEP